MSTLLKRLQDDPIYNSQHVSQLMKITEGEDDEDSLFVNNSAIFTVKYQEHFIVITKKLLIWFDEKLVEVKRKEHRTDLIAEAHTALIHDEILYLISTRYTVMIRGLLPQQDHVITAKKSPYVITAAEVINDELMMLTPNNLMRSSCIEAAKTKHSDLRFLFDTDKFTYLIDWTSSSLVPLEKLYDEADRLYYTVNDDILFESSEISIVQPMKLKNNTMIISRVDLPYETRYLHFDSKDYIYTDTNNLSCTQFIYRDNQYRYYVADKKLMKCPIDTINISKSTVHRNEATVHVMLDLTEGNLGFVVSEGNNWYAFVGAEAIVGGTYTQSARPFYSQELNVVGVAAESFGVDTLSIFVKGYKSPSHDWKDYKMSCLVVYFNSTKNPRLEWIQGYTQDSVESLSGKSIARITRYPGSSEQLTIELSSPNEQKLVHLTTWNAQFNDISIQDTSDKSMSIISDLVYENGEVELPNFKFYIDFTLEKPVITERGPIYKTKSGKVSLFCNEWQSLEPSYLGAPHKAINKMYQSSCIHNNILYLYDPVNEKINEYLVEDFEDKAIYQ